MGFCCSISLVYLILGTQAYSELCSVLNSFLHGFLRVLALKCKKHSVYAIIRSIST